MVSNNSCLALSLLETMSPANNSSYNNSNKTIEHVQVSTNIKQLVVGYAHPAHEISLQPMYWNNQNYGWSSQTPRAREEKKLFFLFRAHQELPQHEHKKIILPCLYKGANTPEHSQDSSQTLVPKFNKKSLVLCIAEKCQCHQFWNTSKCQYRETR